MSELSDQFGSRAKRFTVIVPQDNGYKDPATLGRITEHFMQLGLKAEFELAQNGLPKQDQYGAFTLVTYDDKAERMAPRILDSHYGLVPIPD